MIEVTLLNNKRFDVKVKSSGKLLGTFQMDVNGYYYFHPLKENNGVWNSDALIKIGKELAKLNKELDEVSKLDYNLHNKNPKICTMKTTSTKQ